MVITALPLDHGAQARALLHHLLEAGDVIGRDTAGRTIVQLAVDDWTLDKLMAFDADEGELEDGADDELEPDDEEDGSPVVVNLMVPKVVRRVRAFGQVD